VLQGAHRGRAFVLENVTVRILTLTSHFKVRIHLFSFSAHSVIFFKVKGTEENRGFHQLLVQRRADKHLGKASWRIRITLKINFQISQWFQWQKDNASLNFSTTLAMHLVIAYAKFAFTMPEYGIAKNGAIENDPSDLSFRLHRSTFFYLPLRNKSPGIVNVSEVCSISANFSKKTAL